MKKKNKFMCKTLMLLVALFLFKSNVVKANDEFKYEGQFGYSYSNNIVKFKYYSSTANKISVIIEGISQPIVLNESDNVWGGAVNGEELFDVYQGEHIQDGFKSMAFRIKMQDKDATLTDETVEEQMTSIRNNLKKSFAELSFRE